MKITVEFDSEEEFEAFRTSGKRTRTSKKGEADDAQPATVPSPMQPPTGGQSVPFNPAGFAPQGAIAAPAASGFPAAAATGPAPEVLALVQRITARLGQTTPGTEEQALQWFRNQCVPHDPSAASATMDQIKTAILPKLGVPALTEIAKLMNA